MKTIYKSLISFCCCLVILLAQAQEPVLSNASFDQVLAVSKREADARISYGPDPLQFGELWLPENTAEPVPLLVMIHGGCWLNSFDVSHTYGFNTALAEQGYAVWALEYRRTGDEGGGWPGSFEDIQAGILASEALAEYGVDTNRVALLGHSAGGHLALLAGLEPDLAETIDLVVGLAAIVDIEKYSLGSGSCQAATAQFMNGTLEEVPSDYAAANPHHKHLHIRTILFHGDVDQIVPVAQAELEGADTHVFQGAGHFDWIHPGTSAFAYLLALLGELF